MKRFPVLPSLYSSLRKVLLITVASSVIFISCQKSVDAPEDQTAAAALSNDAKTTGSAGINVLLKSPANDQVLAELGKYGTVINIISEINAVVMRASAQNVDAIRNLAFVEAANPDAERKGAPIDAVAISDFTAGINTWNLDAINVTDLGVGRTIAHDGSGVFIGVLDTGLPDSWRQYFPNERIAEQYARSFGGGGGINGNVSEQPNKWEHDQNSHGGHVTSSIIGYKLGNNYVNGVAPKATIIPVKVLNQNGRGWSSVIARGIVYMAELKMGPLQNSPVIVNMSLGGGVLDAVEKAAIDFAISKGVIIVASAGNEGESGMGYPGAYAPVISVASAGWTGQWSRTAWWNTGNVSDPTSASELFISDFSSRQKPGQDLDVVAPGENVVGPYQINSGQLSYYYLSGTSMASPHVAGIVALMMQNDPTLTPAAAESILVDAASQIPMGAGSRNILLPGGQPSTISWPATASGSGFVTATAALNAMP